QPSRSSVGVACPTFRGDRERRRSTDERGAHRHARRAHRTGPRRVGELAADVAHDARPARCHDRRVRARARVRRAARAEYAHRKGTWRAIRRTRPDTAGPFGCGKTRLAPRARRFAVLPNGPALSGHVRPYIFGSVRATTRRFLLLRTRDTKTPQLEVPHRGRRSRARRTRRGRRTQQGGAVFAADGSG